MRTGIAVLAAFLMVWLPATAGAQEAGSIALSTPYPGVLVEPGDTASFEVRITSTPGRTFELRVEGLPPEWESSVRGGGMEVSRVAAGEGEASATIEVDVTAPLDATEGTHPFSVSAAAGDGSRGSLELEVSVTAGLGGDVVLTPEFPALRGPSDATFTFTVEVENQTAEEVQLELSASGPEGWRTEARPAGENRASTISVAAGSRQRVTVEARPPVTVDAGDYEVVFRASGAGIEEELPLAVRITGEVALELSTPDQRLNATVEAGEPTVIPLVVVNSGTSPLTAVELSATAPRNWDVTFQPDTIPSLSAGEVATVDATVTPASDALAGDYRITFRSSVEQARDSVEIRTTVDPSTTWGLIGAGVIALTLGGLAGIFRRFGRR